LLIFTNNCNYGVIAAFVLLAIAHLLCHQRCDDSTTTAGLHSYHHLNQSHKHRLTSPNTYSANDIHAITPCSCPCPCPCSFSSCRCAIVVITHYRHRHVVIDVISPIACDSDSVIIAQLKSLRISGFLVMWNITAP
jgi:hypothetical protein